MKEVDERLPCKIPSGPRHYNTGHHELRGYLSVIDNFHRDEFKSGSSTSVLPDIDEAQFSQFSIYRYNNT